jgi:membrane dipeptidase
MGMENGYPIADKINRVKEFYDLGVRYITLCHSKNNQICTSLPIWNRKRA